jgi:hypothetical protein
MAIAALEFGKTLRPSTVELINKINETIAAVNALNPAAVEQLTSDVAALKTTTSGLTTKITTNTNNIAALTQTQTSHTQDIDKMKVTLYTPLASPDTDPSATTK